MANNVRTTVDSIKIADLERHPVWEFINDDSNEMALRPVEKRPADSLAQRIVGTKVSLSNGIAVWATLGNVDVDDPRSTEQFLCLSINKDGNWLPLARSPNHQTARRRTRPV